MKHIVLLKLAPGADIAEVRESIWKTYSKLDHEQDWLNHPVIFPRCDDTESDFDLMVSVEIEAAERLKDYLAHPLTQKLQSKLEALTERKATFDHY